MARGITLPSRELNPTTMAKAIAIPTLAIESPKVTWAIPHPNPKRSGSRKIREGIEA
jgi:hypothetical protein